MLGNRRCCAVSIRRYSIPRGSIIGVVRTCVPWEVRHVSRQPLHTSELISQQHTGNPQCAFGRDGPAAHWVCPVEAMERPMRTSVEAKYGVSGEKEGEGESANETIYGSGDMPSLKAGFDEVSGRAQTSFFRSLWKRRTGQSGGGGRFASAVPAETVRLAPTRFGTTVRWTKVTTWAIP